MPDFGVQATELSAPQGAGATPIAPVQRQEAGINLSAVGNVISTVSDYLAQSRKKEAEDAKNAFLTDVARKVKTVDDGVMTGQYSRAEAGVLRRAIYQSAGADRPDLTEDLSKVANFAQSFGTSGANVKQEESERDIRNGLIKAAADNGLPYYTGASPEYETSMINAYQESVRLNAELKAKREAAAEIRNQTKFDQEQLDRQVKEDTAVGLTALSGKHLDAFNELALSLARSVQKGEMDSLSAQGQLQKYYSQIQGTIAAISAQHPELSSSFKSLFTSTMDSVKPYLEKGGDVTELENQVKRMKLQTTLGFFKDPEFLKASVGSELLKNYPEIMQYALPSVARAFAKSTQPSKPGEESSDRLLGNSKVEESTYQVLNKTLSAVTGPKATPQVKEEAKNAVKSVLTEFSDMYKLNKLSPESRTRMFNMVGSADFGKYIKENPLDAEGQRGLQDVFRSAYVSQFEQGLNRKVGQILEGNAVPAAGAAGAPPSKSITKYSDKPINELVDIKFQGGSLIVTPKPNVKGISVENQTRVVSELNQAASAYSKVIRIGAHLEGNTDYAKFWEDNKHALLPSMGYPIPKKEVAPVDQVPAKSGYSTEDQLRQQVTIPGGGVDLDKNASIKQLKRELANTDDPAKIRIYMEELNKLLK